MLMALRSTGPSLWQEGSWHRRRAALQIPVTDRDLLLIPSVAIHMNREANKGYAYNAQTDLLPLLQGRCRRLPEDRGRDCRGIAGWRSPRSDLFLYVRGRGSVWGASNEFVSAGHLTCSAPSPASGALSLGGDKDSRRSGLCLL